MTWMTDIQQNVILKLKYLTAELQFSESTRQIEKNIKLNLKIGMENKNDTTTPYKKIAKLVLKQN
jgi:hypothetical protein